MIKAILSGGREVRILFQHNDFKKKAKEIAREQGMDPERVEGLAGDIRANKLGAWKVYTHSTVARIVEGDREHESTINGAEAESWCALGDNFCRATGRELALKRAIENGKFNRIDSGLLLASYYNRNKGKRKETPVTNNEDK